MTNAQPTYFPIFVNTVFATGSVIEKKDLEKSFFHNVFIY